MFIKWQTRSRVRSTKHLGDLLTCSLVESCRVDGKPRHRVVAYLGSVRDMLHSNHRIAFWNNVQYRLDQIGLEPDARAKIEATIAMRVPHTLEAERER